MDKKLLHEIGNYLHQIISHSEYIMQMNSSSDVNDYATKIKKSAYSIDAIISDSVAKKQEIAISKSSIDTIDFEQFVGMKIMIVDDIGENIEIMQNIFNTFSCEIVSANNGEKALEIYKNGFSPEVVCMDIIMPGMDGAETTRQLKSLGCGAFFIAVSALKNQSNQVVSIFDSWLPKPFTIEHIIGSLAKYKSTPRVCLEVKNDNFMLDLDHDIKDELLEKVNNGAYSSLMTLIKTLPQSKSKEFLQKSLQKMDFNSIKESILSS